MTSEQEDILAARYFAFQDGLVGVLALADLLGKTPKAVYDLKYRGLLPPAIRIGGTIYWLAEDIEGWIAKNKEVAQ